MDEKTSAFPSAFNTGTISKTGNIQLVSGLTTLSTGQMEILSLTDFLTSCTPRLRRPWRVKSVPMTKGECLCGKIKFEFPSEPLKTIRCHCIVCKRLTGTSYSTHVTVPSMSLRFVGSPRQFLFNSGQGPEFTISFCGTCSSTLWKESDADGFKGCLMVQAGTLAQEGDRDPADRKTSTKKQVRWVDSIKGIT